MSNECLTSSAGAAVRCEDGHILIVSQANHQQLSVKTQFKEIAHPALSNNSFGHAKLHNHQFAQRESHVEIDARCLPKSSLETYTRAHQLQQLFFSVPGKSSMK